MKKRPFFRSLLALSVLCFLPGWAVVHAETTNYSGATAITSIPCVLSTPGTYYLSQDFSVNLSNNYGIGIAASGVTIDLNGHTITNTNGAANTAYGIYASNWANVTVRNGTISGFFYGVLMASSSFTASTTSYGHLVENVNFVKNTFCAADLQGIGCRYYHCRAVLTGGASNESTYFNFALDGTGNSIEDCDVSSKVGSNPAYGITVANGVDNFVLNNRISGVDDGILLLQSNAGFKYSYNLTSGVTTPYTGGTNAGNNN